MKKVLILSDRSISNRHDFAGFNKLVDFASNPKKNDKVILSILQKNPEVTGIYFNALKSPTARSCVLRLLLVGR